MTEPVVVFDLDGTLVDSAPGILQVLDAMRAARGLTPCTVESVRRWIGLGASELVRAAFGEDQEEAASSLIEFRKRYALAITPRADMYPGTRSALRRLLDAGARLGVCSNKPHALTEKVLHDLDIRSMFVGVAGGDAVAASKPHPDHLFKTLARMGCVGRPFVFVGDSEIDADAADAAGARFLWVAYGYGSRSALSHRGETVEAAEEIVDKVLCQTR